MKTAAKVFIYISFVLAIVSLVIFGILTLVICLTDYNNIKDSIMGDIPEEMLQVLRNMFIIGFVIFVLYSIATFIVGSKTLKMLQREYTKNDLILYGVLDLIFVNFIAGLLILLMDPAKDEKVDNLSNDITASLEKLQRMKDNNVITLEEYQTLRNRIIEGKFDK